MEQPHGKITEPQIPDDAIDDAADDAETEDDEETPDTGEVEPEEEGEE